MGKNVAILLAAGSGKRMKSNVKKQYMDLCERPVIYYSLKVFNDSFIDEIVMVVSPGDEEYCRREIVEKYGFNKVSAIVPGGKERYHSVYAGLNAVSDCDFIFIHDGARAFVDQGILERCLESVKSDRACVAAVPAKDTIKKADDSGYVCETLNRNLLWQIQTPQVFAYDLIKECYRKLIENEAALTKQGIAITDDTMAVEHFSDTRVKLVMGSYNNIKITTPEDIPIGETILSGMSKITFDAD